MTNNKKEAYNQPGKCKDNADSKIIMQAANVHWDPVVSPTDGNNRNGKETDKRRKRARKRI